MKNYAVPAGMTLPAFAATPLEIQQFLNVLLLLGDVMGSFVTAVLDMLSAVRLNAGR